MKSLLLLAVIACATVVHADTFGTGANEFEIDFRVIGGDRFILNDTHPYSELRYPNSGEYVYRGQPGYGRVIYAYRIGTYEIRHGDIEKANAEAGLGIAMEDATENQPATGVSWYDAARFVNWLNTSTGNQEAYRFDGGEFALWDAADAWSYGGENLFRHKDAFYFLPNEDEWYKAAYHLSGSRSTYYQYSTAAEGACLCLANELPTSVTGGTEPGTAVFNLGPDADFADIDNAGGLSFWRTMGQGGNAAEWVESYSAEVWEVNQHQRSYRGGSARSPADNGSILIGVENDLMSTTRYNFAAGQSLPDLGFRVARSDTIPEPSAIALCFVAVVVVAWRRQGATQT